MSQGSLKVNRRSKLALDLTKVDAQLVALSVIITFQDVKITSLSNAISDNETTIESWSNAYYPWKASTNGKITTLQEFDLVFYDDLRNLDNKIDVIADNALQNTSNIISLSNTLVNYHITTSNLDDKLTYTYLKI